MAIQLLALSLGVFRVPLAARVAQPEQFSIHVMLVTQVIASSLLFPVFLRDGTTSVMVILTIAPFLQLAAYISDVPMARASLAVAYLALWMISLAICRPLLRTRRNEMLAIAGAAALSLAGAIVWYVRAESREAAPIDWRIDALFGPILGAIAQIHAPRSAALTAWLLPVVALVTCAFARLSLHARRDR